MTSNPAWHDPAAPAIHTTTGDTDYYFHPTDNLPLFEPLRTLGVPEQVIDVVEPVAKVVVERGYDRSIPPGEPTPARLIPPINPVKVAADLVNAVGEGITNAQALTGSPPLRKIPAPGTSADTNDGSVFGSPDKLVDLNAFGDGIPNSLSALNPFSTDQGNKQAGTDGANGLGRRPGDDHVVGVGQRSKTFGAGSNGAGRGRRPAGNRASSSVCVAGRPASPGATSQQGLPFGSVHGRVLTEFEVLLCQPKVNNAPGKCDPVHHPPPPATEPQQARARHAARNHRGRHGSSRGSPVNLLPRVRRRVRRPHQVTRFAAFRLGTW